MKYQRSEEGLLSSQLDDELVMLNEANGDYLTLNIVSTRIWSLIATPLNMEEIVSALREEYDVPETECTEQVAAFLLKLEEYGALKKVA